MGFQETRADERPSAVHGVIREGRQDSKRCLWQAHPRRAPRRNSDLLRSRPISRLNAYGLRKLQVELLEFESHSLIVDLVQKSACFLGAAQGILLSEFAYKVQDTDQIGALFGLAVKGQRQRQ